MKWDAKSESGFEEDEKDEILTQYVSKVASQRPSIRMSQASTPEYRKNVIPLQDENYSLGPDMIFGWRPRDIQNQAPIPLKFNLEQLPNRINFETQEEAPVIYHGPWPRDSLFLHQKFSSEETYPFEQNPRLASAYEYMSKQNQIRDHRQFLGNSLVYDSELCFDSDFESGNLDKATLFKKNTYDLYMRHDTNARGHNLWFYFSVSNIKHKRKVRFNILNFTKKHSLYTQGMQVWIYSKMRQEKEGKGWFRGGENIEYVRSPINQYVNMKKTFHCLSFEYRFKDPDDTVYFAYSMPYTFTKLYRFVQKLQNENKYVQVDSLCRSLGGLDVPLITISDFSNSTEVSRPVIFWTSRVHPGESNSSWVIHGFIDYITGNSMKAFELRKQFVFKIVPMMNPDGVVVGNYRKSFSGSDLNRTYQKPNDRLHPTVFAVKNTIAQLQKDSKVIAFFDFHGHSRKKSVFVYAPRYPLHHKNYYKQRIIPKLMSEKSEMFRYWSCKFRVEKGKRKAARLVIWKEFGIVNCYTLESSFQGFFNSDRVTIPFTTNHFKEIGSNLGQVLGTYRRLITDIRRTKLKKCPPQIKRIPSDQLLPGPGLAKANSPRPKPIQRRTIYSIIEEIKSEDMNCPPEPNSSSDEDQDVEMPFEEEEELHKNLLHTINQFEQFQQFPKSRQIKSRIDNQYVRPEVRSWLEKYFSRARSPPKPKGKLLKIRRKVMSNQKIDMKLKDADKDAPSPKEKEKRRLHRLSASPQSTSPEQTPRTTRKPQKPPRSLSTKRAKGKGRSTSPQITAQVSHTASQSALHRITYQTQQENPVFEGQYHLERDRHNPNYLSHTGFSSKRLATIRIGGAQVHGNSSDLLRDSYVHHHTSLKPVTIIRKSSHLRNMKNMDRLNSVLNIKQIQNSKNTQPQPQRPRSAVRFTRKKLTELLN